MKIGLCLLKLTTMVAAFPVCAAAWCTECAGAQNVPPSKVMVQKVDIVDADLVNLASLLEVQTGVKIHVVQSEIPYGRVTMSLRNKPLDFVVQRVAKSAGATVELTNGGYTFGPKESAEKLETSISKAVVPEILRGVRRIVTLGDSITQMGGQTGGYVSLMQKSLTALYPDQKIEIVNAGISGHKSTDMAARFQHDVLDQKPDLITISVGVNDVWHGFYDNHPLGDGPRGVPLEVYRDKVEGMIEAGKAAGAKVVVLSTTVIHENLSNRENAKIASYNRTLKELAAKHGCPFVDLFTAFSDVIKAYQKHAGSGSNILTTDGVHMNGAGNQLMAYSILRALGISDKEFATIKR